MAKVVFLFQAVTSDCHADALKKLLSRKDLQRFIASVAFFQQSGVLSIAKELSAVSKVATFFVGIRNDVTSMQGLEELLKLGVRVFVVDTAARSPIFHPKLYIAQGKTEASMIIGSANMTFSGLHNNIEASAMFTLDLALPEDSAFYEYAEGNLDELPVNFPAHVFRVKDRAELLGLLDEGRLIDEDTVIAPVVSSTLRKGDRDKLPRMKLVRHAPPVRKRQPAKFKASVVPFAPARGAAVPQSVLIWESRELTERDLNIPSGKTTHATGSMLWKKGAMDHIDQRHFFRDEVFAGLDWKRDKTKTHIERAEASIQIIVKGLNYGTFTLKLSHNTRTTSESYKQKNSMTQIHWGEALRVVAKRDLLGRTMSLYRRDSNPPEFTIEID